MSIEKIIIEIILVIISYIILFILNRKQDKELYRIKKELEISKDTTKNLKFMFDKLIGKK